MRPLVKFEVVLAALSFALIFGAGVAGHFAVRWGMEPKTAERLAQGAMLLLFCFFGFALIGIMIHAFTVLQTGIGNGNVPMVRFLASHESGVTFAVWGFLGIGALVALPFAFRDLGFRLPLRSRGTLVADIGMTVEEVKQRSSLRMPEPRLMGDGARLGVEKMVFEFCVGDSGVCFPFSRYYWIETPRNDPHVSVMNVGITPQKMSQAELDAFQHDAQSRLLAHGWMPGHYVADSEETVRLWGGKRTTQDGRYWLRHNTVLSFERKRMDDARADEPPGSGEFIVDIHLQTKAAARDVVFEPSAWSPGPP